MFQAHIVTMRIDSHTSTREILAHSLVLRHGLLQPLPRDIIDVATHANLPLGHRRAQIAATLLHHLLLTCPDHVRVIQNRVPQGQLQVADQLHDPAAFTLRNEALSECQVGTEPHASRDSVPVQHASRNLVPGRPCVPIGVRPALVRLPQVAVLTFHVSLHGLSDDSIAHLAKFRVFRARGAKLRRDQSAAGLLQELKQRQVLHHSHLDDLSDSVPHPALLQCVEESSISQRQNWRVIRAIQILVPKAIAARARRGASVDPRYNRRAQHHVRCVPVIQGSRKPSHIRDHATSDNQHGLIAGHRVHLQVLQDLFHGRDVLVSFHSTVHQLGQLHTVVREVLAQILTPLFVHKLVHNGDAFANRLVHLAQRQVGGVQHTRLNLDCCGDGRGHHTLDH
mmetsp:Transcript_92960/g.212713  ORF Transcript_92960/g.212713 Transcript_92960/m.212713 type:complete len:395 (-) Transcript_92960:603-1787(-)